MDLNGDFNYINKTGVELFRNNEKMIKNGIIIRRYVSPDNIEEVQRGLSVVISGAKSPRDIYTLRQLNGELIRAIVSTSLIRRDGRITGFRGIVLDISE